jgi:hypothetical protein
LEAALKGVFNRELKNLRKPSASGMEFTGREFFVASGFCFRVFASGVGCCFGVVASGTQNARKHTNNS